MTTGSDPYVGPYLGNPVPNVAQVMLAGQTVAITDQPLLGGNTVAGLYRVTLMIGVTQAAGATATMTLSCGCQSETNENLRYALPPQTVGPSSVTIGIQSGQFIVSANAAGDITWRVEFQGPAPGGTFRYLVRVLVERLTSF